MQDWLPVEENYFSMSRPYSIEIRRAIEGNLGAIKKANNMSKEAIKTAYHDKK